MNIRFLFRVLKGIVSPFIPDGWQDAVSLLSHFIEGSGKEIEWASEEVLAASLIKFNDLYLKEKLKEEKGVYVVSYGDYPKESAFIPLEGFGHLDKFSPSMACVGGFAVEYEKSGDIYKCKLVDIYNWDEVIRQRIPNVLKPFINGLPNKMKEKIGVIDEDYFLRDWNKFGKSFTISYEFQIVWEGEWVLKSGDFKDIHVEEKFGVYRGYYPALRERAERARINWEEGKRIKSIHRKK